MKLPPEVCCGNSVGTGALVDIEDAVNIGICVGIGIGIGIKYT